MGLTIANNVSSLTAQNQLNKSSARLTRSIERLSSGVRVNRGADDPSGLVISERRRAQISGLQKAIQNSDKAVSLVQTAEGALSEINTLLVKIRGLAIDSANAGVNDADAQAANQAEIFNALQTIDRIATNTQFGTKNLLDGSCGISGVPTDPNVTFLKAGSDISPGVHTVAVTSAARRPVVAAAMDNTDTMAVSEILVVNGISISLESGATQSHVINRINEFTSTTGVVADAGGAGSTLRLYSLEYGSAAKLTVTSNQAVAANGTGLGMTPTIVPGADIAGTFDGVAAIGIGNMLKAPPGTESGLVVQIASSSTNALQTATIASGNIAIHDNSLVFQIGPNPNQSSKITVPQIYAKSLGVGVAGNQFRNLGEIDVSSAAKAQHAISIIDAAISDVTILRGELGSFQGNTLESTANNLRTTLENTVAAESTIRDTDFASEIANFTKQQILVQAGTSVLSNANQIPQQVLSLLNN
ncbi:flagellin [Planctomicrobium sp. SH668]|uniref:flagellin N-terminal helical domain-containing protein n=1 Tax=Planctomicrobium sp. SH668 TaxID=3448126 RepID=UPI003F5BFFB1